ncbi:unnamed protein product [Leuciscus chuanchicus]
MARGELLETSRVRWEEVWQVASRWAHRNLKTIQETTIKLATAAVTRLMTGEPQREEEVLVNPQPAEAASQSLDLFPRGSKKDPDPNRDSTPKPVVGQEMPQMVEQGELNSSLSPVLLWEEEEGENKMENKAGPSSGKLKNEIKKPTSISRQAPKPVSAAGRLGILVPQFPGNPSLAFRKRYRR